jgi:hypothetical protein
MSNRVAVSAKNDTLAYLCSYNLLAVSSGDQVLHRSQLIRRIHVMELQNSRMVKPAIYAARLLKVAYERSYLGATTLLSYSIIFLVFPRKLFARRNIRASTVPLFHVGGASAFLFYRSSNRVAR